MSTRSTTWLPGLCLLGPCLVIAAAGFFSPATAQWVPPPDVGWSSGPAGEVEQRDHDALPASAWAGSAFHT